MNTTTVNHPRPVLVLPGGGWVMARMPRNRYHDSTAAMIAPNRRFILARMARAELTPRSRSTARSPRAKVNSRTANHTPTAVTTVNAISVHSTMLEDLQLLQEIGQPLFGSLSPPLSLSNLPGRSQAFPLGLIPHTPPPLHSGESPLRIESTTSIAC